MPTEKCVMDPERDCVSLERVEALEEQFREQREKSSATHKEFYNRIRELEKQIGTAMDELDKMLQGEE